MMMEKMKKETIVLFPFMSHGHLNPFLALALQLEQKGYSVIFVNTPLNIKKLRHSLPSNSSVRLIQIPFNSSDHGLPSDSENTDDLPYNLVLRLLDVSSCLQLPFRDVLADLVGGGERPLCVIGDFFFGWSADVAHEYGIFHAVFSGAGGFGLACYYSMWLNLPHRESDKGEFLLPDFSEAGKFHVSQLSPSLLIADGSDPFSIFQRKCLPTWGNSDGFLFNTVEELDKIGLAYFRRKLGIPVWAIGPIFLPIDDRERVSPSSESVAELGISPEQCIQFLDSKPENSVLYISFGLQTTISASQMMQLAKALDAGETNFIWVVRPPVGFDINADFKAEEWLPEGFVQRIKDEKKGMIVEKWAPQWQILSHKSTGAFLSHCGWNSVLESLSNGVPLIGWPIAGDQFNNAKLLAEWTGVCLEVARGVNFEVRHEDIRDKIELVMGDDNDNNNNNIYYNNNNNRGKEMRRKACEVREMIKENIRDEENYKGASIVAMEEFLNLALQMKEETAGDDEEGELQNN